MNFLKFAFFFTLSVLFQGLAYAQEWTSYESQQQINDLVDTGDELLLATDAGLVVLNKATLEKTIFNKANSSLTNNHIQTITLAPNGNAWIGTYDVILSRFDGTDFQDMILPQDDAINDNTELYDFKIAPNGDFWLGTSDGVFQGENQNWSHYDSDDFGPSFFEAWDIEIDSDGVVFMSSVDVHKFENGVWSNITEGTAIENYLGSDLFFSTSGDLYDAGDLDEIGRFDGTEWQTYDIDLNGSEVIKFTEDVDGSIYFNTQRDGIFKLVDDVWIQQTNPQTEAFNNVTPYFYIDEDGNRWLNKNIHLSVNKSGDIQSTLISQHTIESNNVGSVHTGDNGKMYFITGSQDNFSVVDADGNWSFLPKPAMAMPFEFYNDMLVLADDNIWVITNNGLYHYTGNDWILNAMISGGGLDIDSQGKIYVRSENKIIVLDNGEMSEYNASNSALTGLYISGHGIDVEDNLWIATGSWDEDNLIQKLSTDGTWTTYDKANHPVIERPVGDFHFDINGNVWIAEGNVGALKFDGTEFTNPFIGNLDQMANYDAYSIESDAEGKIYFSHQYGVTTLMGEVWEDFLIEDVPQVASSHGSSLKFDEDGILWWASSRYGVFSYAGITTSANLPVQKSITAFSIYPNPAVNYTTIDFTTKENAKVKALIYNQLGQVVSSLDLGQLPAGTFQQQINIDNFPKGIYNIQLQVNNSIFTKMIIAQ